MLLAETPLEQAQVRVTPKRILGTFAAVPLANLIKDIPGLRDKLPEPFDVVDHMSNVGYGLYPGYIIGSIAAKLSIFRQKRELIKPRSYVDEERTKSAMLVAGLAVGSILNAAVETRYGLSLFGDYKVSQSTPDLIDFAYGVTATGLAAVALPELHQQTTSSQYTNYE